ncbi:hypothetical protein BN946_scf185014.g108 [Trametes cinnabarina]|uniref:Uncharacterized protein n=1 Tax=Pycnoporus cinnabarinus TaxID=5643 RepID=A0A060SMI8_PYCCI|nr:hypothetical protein BN946_scf185014.g108 [Trametes cinnabarina]
MTVTTTQVDVPALKAIKNSIIGNRTAKAALAKNDSLVARLIDYIRESPHNLDSTEETHVRIEAAHIIASLSYGSPDALRTLLRLDALQALLYAISTLPPSEQSSLKAALTRSLRALAAAIADAVGPSQWGLSPTVSDARPEAKVALDYLFQPEVLDIYIPLLLDPSPTVNIATAQLLSVAVRNTEHRGRVLEWCPPVERAREVKGKRGWERRDPTASPSRRGGWIARTLTTLLIRKDVKVCSATSILRACNHTIYDSPVFANDQAYAITIMHVLNRIIESETASNPVRTKACFILYHLVSDNRVLCQLAFERNSLAKVATLINTITPTEKVPEFEEDEPESVSRLREAALTAVAAIALFDTDIRTAVTDDLRLIPAIQFSLTNRYVGVRYAACQCARALSRAVSALRTNIVDTGLGLAVFQLFMKQDEDRRVMHAASAVICNVVTNFSPLRTALLEQGVIPRLVQLLRSSDIELKLNALWAFKNLLYKASPELKREVISAIGWSEISSLFLDSDSRLQEQVFHILRHVADGVEDVELLFSEMAGDEGLLDNLAQAMDSDNEDVVLQSVFVLANIANSPAHQASILSHSRILGRLRDCLVDAKVEIRRPAVSCVLELARQNPRSYRELHEARIDTTLRHMLEHTSHVAASPTLRFGRQMGTEDDMEVQDKARQALHWLEQAQLNRESLTDTDL